MARKPTMAELARVAEVDVSTVSRALSDSPRVKQSTKDHIREIADKIGYEVNVTARNLRKQSTETIGVAVPVDPAWGQTISDPFYLEMLGAVSTAAAKRGYDLLLTVPQNDARVAERRLLRSGKVDGLIIIGQADRADRLNSLSQITDKFVVWGGVFDDARYTIVGSDNIEGGRSATLHLLGQGRTRILFVGDTSLPEVALRHEGFRKAHQERGVEVIPDLALPVGFGARNTAAFVTQKIVEGEKFDAIFAASDVLAMSAMAAVTQAGLKIPTDVAVVGYDNVTASATAMPPLTTIDQNVAYGGEMMVDLLLKKIRGEKVRSALTPTELVVRRSSH